MSTAGIAAGAWGLVGVVALLLRAIVTLTPLAFDAYARLPLNATHWVLGSFWFALMGYFEGYRGFQRGFSRRVVRRAVHLAEHPRPLHAALAPLFCMGLFHATRRRLAISWTVLMMIVALVLTVRLVPQPWRGLVDAGVVFGLTWGVVALLFYAARAVAGRPPAISADLP